MEIILINEQNGCWGMGSEDEYKVLTEKGEDFCKITVEYGSVSCDQTIIKIVWSDDRPGKEYHDIGCVCDECLVALAEDVIPPHVQHEHQLAQLERAGCKKKGD